MEAPLLTKSEQIVDTTIVGGSSSNAESTINITVNDNLSSNDERRRFVHVQVQPYDPCSTYEGVWDLIEFVMDLVQIVAAIIVLSRTKGEHREATWIICYTCGCILSLPVLYWRIFRNEDVNSDLGINGTVGFSHFLLDFFFTCWFLIFTWVFLAESTLDHSIPLFWLCWAFLACSCIRFVQLCVSACV